MRINPPESCTSLTLNFVGVFCFFVAIFVVNLFFEDVSLLWRTVFACFALILPILLVEVFKFKIYKNPTAKLSVKRNSDNYRVIIKFIGLITTFAIIAFFYWIFPEYHGDFYKQFFKIALYVAPILLLFSWYYIAEIDSRMKDPEDGYWHLGCVVLGKWNLVNNKILAEHFRGWIVKAFFLPLMFTYAMSNVDFIHNYNYENLTSSFIAFYDYAYVFIFTIDVSFACVGYFMTFRFLDSHIRSVEPTFLGWVVALMCYSPFWSAVFYGMYLNYNDNFYWGHMTNNLPLLQYVWGTAILICIAVYSTATVCLGYRFSNLTYRGLVAHGPYRWTKHPAYVSKNLSWWLISVPFFVSGDLSDSIRQCVMLLGVNYIYYLRARTEENHLSNYPEYVEYAKWIEKHGKLRWIGNLIPYFRYSEERAKSWNSKTWWQQMGKKEY